MATPETSRPANLRDVAKAAGVSLTLASFALNGREGVAEKTRKRILQAADQLGYRANPYARALRRGRSATFGLVVRNLSNPYFLDVIAGAEEVAHEAGVALLVLDSDYSLERESAHVERLADYRVEGLAIAPVGTGDAIRLWRDLSPGRPTVALNAVAAGIAGISRVAPDNRRAVELPVRRLAELGHQEVSFVAAPQALMADGDRLRYFRRVAREAGVAARVIRTPLSVTGVEQAIGSAITRGPAPTAVICNSDYTALGVYRAARTHRVGIGARLSVVGHDDLPTSAFLDPPLATLALDRRRLGRVLMSRLLDDGPAADHREPVEFLERKSLVRAPRPG
ncbi:LacI family DNA-binding transcriptional regulator [Pedococcus sp. 5OH_020]|uniref:LacI family DNA-binding transcriptional regulator n=1 Tax=Pedococcus sp. 5OH_020 TaxID=2989814 RepID=UPI0022E99DE4|nr:LacI family DNA-binding transcriptional regulator [Pedococcus sp. 5OH_020]